MEPQNLAPNRSKQKDGRAAVSPLGQVNPPPTRLRVEQRVSDKWKKSKS
jgi:hypothetical protein